MIMKKSILSFWLLVILLSLSAYAQVLRPAQWSYSVSKPELNVGEEVDLLMTVTVDQDWYIYSSDLDPDLGPTPTTFSFKPHDSYKLVGKVSPVTKPKTKYEAIWEGDIRYFTGKAQFKQRVKILKPDPVIAGSSDYQVCTEKDGRCIPLNEEFSFSEIKVRKKAEAPPTETIPTPVKNPSAVTTVGKASDMTTTAQAPLSNTDSSDTAIAPRGTAATDQAVVATTAPATDARSEGLWMFLLGAFGAGLLALLTPCVYPLIPMTVTMFTNQSRSKRRGITNALVYGLSIVGIYTLIGLLFTSIFGADSANFISTHWIPNVAFFLIFVVFGLSFLGLFEMVLPHSLVNKVDAQADRGGLYGIFFMAFTLALVSFSCTAPIAGSLLILASQGETIRAALGMVAYSLAFAIPFTLFAIFPSWLKSLPKSGGWLNSVKVVLGFLELALAFKFLSNADLVYHWGLLDRDVFLAIWIVLFALIGFYLLGKIRLPHDSPLQTVSVPRLMFALAFFSLVVYLVPGLFGAPLKPLAGLLPPQTSQDFNLALPHSGSVPAVSDAGIGTPKYAEFLKLPEGLPGFFDYKEGMAYAKKTGKPVFLDFTGHGCVNCREMEARVWSEAPVLTRLRNDYVIISLYVDEKTRLPESEWYTSTYDNRVKKTLGAQNADLQISRFGNNAQPYYCLLDHAGNLLNTPIGYELDVSNFVRFLDEGKAQFKRIEGLKD
jgi:thiol:disulfide interchange protein DsbD